MAQTCNSIGLPEPQTSNKVKSNNAESNSTKNEKNTKDDSKGCKTSTQADSTSDGIEFGKGKESPTGKKSSDSRHQQNSANEESNKNDINSVSSSAGTAPESMAASSSDTKLSSGHHSSTASSIPSALASTSKCGTCVTPGYPPHMFTHYFPPTSAPGFPYAHSGVPSLPLSCYPSFQSSGMPIFPRLCTDPYCKSCPPNPTIPSLTPSSYGGTARSCPLGCTQCTTLPADLSLWLNSYSLLNAGFHGLSNPTLPSLAAAPNSAALVAAAAAASNPFAGHYPQNFNGQNVPPVCWWNSGEGYCLKRFANAEELLQHLRTHAHESANKSSLLNSTLPGQLSSVSGRLSPRSTSYLNSLNSLRYHPYSKLSPTASVAAPSSTLPHVPFTLNSGAYGLQTSLFGGQRLPGSLPHP